MYWIAVFRSGFLKCLAKIFSSFATVSGRGLLWVVSMGFSIFKYAVLKTRISERKPSYATRYFHPAYVWEVLNLVAGVPAKFNLTPKITVVNNHVCIMRTDSFKRGINHNKNM